MIPLKESGESQKLTGEEHLVPVIVMVGYQARFGFLAHRYFAFRVEQLLFISFPENLRLLKPGLIRGIKLRRTYCSWGEAGFEEIYDLVLWAGLFSSVPQAVPSGDLLPLHRSDSWPGRPGWRRA